MKSFFYPDHLIINYNVDNHQSSFQDLLIVHNGENFSPVQVLLVNDSECILIFKIDDNIGQDLILTHGEVTSLTSPRPGNEKIWLNQLKTILSSPICLTANICDSLHEIHSSLKLISYKVEKENYLAKSYCLICISRKNATSEHNVYTVVPESLHSKVTHICSAINKPISNRVIDIHSSNCWYIFSDVNRSESQNVLITYKNRNFLMGSDLLIKKIVRQQHLSKRAFQKQRWKTWLSLLINRNGDSLWNEYNRCFAERHDANYIEYYSEHEIKVHQEVIKLSHNADSKHLLALSIVTPCYNTDPYLFDELYLSIVNQSYPNWQWIIVDDGSNDLKSTAHIEKRIAKDSRVVFIQSPKNLHISKATNIALKQASGDIVCFVDHDDVLAPIALSAIHIAALKHPDAKWFYSDEDFLSESGVRHSPHLKPSFNPELLKSHNYITHLSAIKRGTLEEVGWLDSDCNGAQDYDLHLRLAQHLDPSEIIHIPLVLYHWRQSEGSTSHNSSAKSYTHGAGKFALSKVFLGKNKQYSVDSCGDHTNYYIVTPKKHREILTSIIIPFKDQVELLVKCLQSISETCTKGEYEIVLINNNSEDKSTIDYLYTLNSQSDIKLIEDTGDFNFSRLINTGAKFAKGEVLLLLNNDIEATRLGWLEELRDHAMIESNGCVGCKLIYPDSSIQHAGVALGLGGYAAHYYRGQQYSYPGIAGRLWTRYNVSAVTAAALAVRKEVFDQVGGLEEDFKVAYNDVDFCLKVHDAGYWNICSCHVELIHHESKSRGQDSTGEKRRRFEREKSLLANKWGQFILDDPFLHPLVTRNNETCGFAVPAEWKVNPKLLTGRFHREHKKHALHI